jgi:hypothetical protein
MPLQSGPPPEPAALPAVPVEPAVEPDVPAAPGVPVEPDAPAVAAPPLAPPAPPLDPPLLQSERKQREQQHADRRAIAHSLPDTN